MSNTDSIVFLLDVDNTLLDNDRFSADLAARLERDFGPEGRDAYNAIDHDLRDQYGYADYLTTLQRFRIGRETHPKLAEMSFFLLDYPFDERVFPGTLDAIAHLRSMGRPVILSDGDVVFQPRKVRRAGLWDAFAGDVLIYVHKEDMLDNMRARYPATHYVMIDDKPRILVALKKIMGDSVTTVFVRQGHYAAAAGKELEETPPDIVLDSIADLRGLDASAFGPRNATA
ncbi:FMN phosphatase YigB (HAD superfamily) [Luteibacter rhizovicinus]|uniref:FMN phosphatase YigB (HAD superfamily) n=1 Tax=Luteibacter rhizovicinus TaxID=242606 RepID=A0A4R3YRE5_9GAMM|nr:HAD family hydrolase [Luteibacter rhizovicinus]TCV93824.1 FMN phosphatase YigB (HAD superfamily) [Luteibacter rhizovicinus]